MNNFTPADEMHRLAKRAMDNGTVASRQEAEALLRGYRIALSIGPDEAIDRHHQAALLTAVELGRRVFLGGVTVEGDLDVPLNVPVSPGPTLRLPSRPQAARQGQRPRDPAHRDRRSG